MAEQLDDAIVRPDSFTKRPDKVYFNELPQLQQAITGSQYGFQAHATPPMAARPSLNMLNAETNGEFCQMKFYILTEVIPESCSGMEPDQMSMSFTAPEFY